MAERRMFAKTIIDSDAFLEMPQSTQLLYFQLSMRADDEGFINNPKAIMRSVGCKDDDINILIMKKFIIPFDKGIIVIKHWRIHNYIQKDRFISTKYVHEKSLLEFDENNAYRLKKNDMDTECIQDVHTMDTQVSIGKVSIVNKDSSTNRFTKPSLTELTDFIKDKQLNVDPEYFLNYYESNGWIVGRTKMKNWKATCLNWSKKQFTNKSKGRVEIDVDYTQPDVIISEDEMKRIKDSFKNLGG